ncbi:simple sugar transport system substrate-binding protein [Thermosporothrix hazakensis]|jgi:simple sugar transport system substrate-binding protein|uniref:Simple sugar transport system substrate-binding protein n=2 Tax=Thermosporothrix TaxID=768650 RepID=A0A326U9W6_THEHA|nr:sugar ABC transporter substrate-binding protein [Thermosporothrix hazakensis]PZW29284.1 simple sugar transport system substrate-binding protein [Thermosporothrix hazakensis]BBH86215.1 sugar ABC transporter substrate-binding protein [Thermosporothrix sp. COM3]GCE45363.1 sugar ABC transporter substrate-binding protein [Thermosporothrix hazakensis]
MLQKVSRVLVSVFLLCILASCANQNSNQTTKPNTDRSNVRFVVVTHGQPADPFWSVVKKGVDQAAKDMGVKVEYQSPDRFDMAAMAHLIDAAVASRPDGLVVSIPDADALSPSIKKAIDAGIPVISMNSGNDAGKRLGVLVHVGQTEYEAGYKGGERMASEGVKYALCINHEVGNAGLDARCQGFSDALKKAGAKVDLLAVELANPTESQQRIEAALAAKPNIDGIMTLGPTGADPALNALRSKNLLGKVKIATFDLSDKVLTAIKNGELDFAIDQQQYLQGYLPVVLLTLYRENLNTVANDVVMTGPGFVTKENVDKVTDLAKKGTR